MLYKGLITAMVTPFNNDGQGINKQAVEQLIIYLIDRGTNGLFTLGTNGESYLVSEKEKLEFVEYVTEFTNGQVPVYAGSGANSTQETIELSKKLSKYNIDALSVITPYFAKHTEEELFQHYKAVAESVDLPIILYNIPARTGNNISAELLERLIEIDNIVGIKAVSYTHLTLPTT